MKQTFFSFSAARSTVILPSVDKDKGSFICSPQRESAVRKVSRSVGSTWAHIGRVGETENDRGHVRSNVFIISVFHEKRI